METKDKKDSGDLMEMPWKPMAILSAVMHVAVFASILLIPDSLPARRSFDGLIYEVSLVDMPGGGGGSPKPGGVPVSRAPAAVKQETPAKGIPETPARRIPEAPKKEEKPVIIAKKTLDKPAPTPEKAKVAPSELIEKAISKIERTVKTEQHLDQALAGVERRAAESSAVETRSEPGPSSGAGLGGGGLGSGGGGIPGGTAMQIYQMQVESLVKSNWSYPVAMDSQKDREAIMALVVKRDGAILSSRFEKKSQNILFDESVIKAIERSNPLPPFPEGFRSHEEIIIRFNLKDLERN